MAIDTLGYVKSLKQAGVPAEQAGAHAEALRDKLIPELATKQDLKEIGATLKTEIAGVKTEMATIRTDMWRIALAMLLGITTLVTAVQKLVH